LFLGYGDFCLSAEERTVSRRIFSWFDISY
jgi:hypothetical protein